MKKFMLLFLFFSVAVSAQESFPYKRPFLILNKTVTVVKIPSSEQLGYFDFYETLKPQKRYKVGSDVTTPEKELLGRSFTVTAIDSINLLGEYDYNLALTDDKETIYYRYSPTNVGTLYPFEVKGGLELPEGFYCDFVEKGKYDYSAKVPEIWLTQSYSEILKRKDTTFHFIFFDTFMVSGVKSVTLLLENNKTITEVVNDIHGWPHGNEYKYDFGVSLEEKQFELLKANRLIAIKLQDSVHTFGPGTGERIAGVLKCIDSLPILK